MILELLSTSFAATIEARSGAFARESGGRQNHVAGARADGSRRSLLSRLSRVDVLVIDDWAMAPLSEVSPKGGRLWQWRR
jgi:hypothetical protein